MFIRYFILFGIVIASAVAFLDSLFRQLETNNCPETNNFRCKNGKCVERKNRCNGRDDCLDGSDEQGCDEFLCQVPAFFKCKNGVCISHVFQCDGENDCGDYSDEIECAGFKISSLNPSNCSQGEWQCNDRLCIPEEWVCNGEVDCLDGSDETLGCTKSIPCDNFKCKNGHCIPNEWRCDGSNDCQDNSDEVDCHQAQLDPNDCHYKDQLFLCANNKTCLNFSQVCDGIGQCSDGSDEGLECNSASNTCKTSKCSHDCKQFPDGPKCLCPKGYRAVSDHTCEDINECDQFGICDQKCQNTHGSYECYCDKKYVLQENKRSCKAVGGEAMIIFSSKTEIRGYFLQSQLYFPMAKRLKQAVGVGFDGHHVYWTDIHSGQESIIRSLEDGSNRELLVTSGLGAPEDLAVDWVTGNIYFTDSEMQHIGVCSNDGKSCTVLINEDIQKPRGLVLDPTNGEMFWSDWGAKPQIGRSFMDGSEPKSFVSDDIQWPNGLAIDYPCERLYWTDAKRQTLESILLDGTDRRVMERLAKHPYSIAIFEDKLYYSDWTTHSIQSCDKFTGKDHRTLLKEKKEYIFGIHIFHSALKPRNDNPCSMSFCSDLCLLSGRGYSCACPQDKTLARDKHICTASEKKQVLLVGGKDFLARIEHRLLGKHELTTLKTTARDILAMCYSPRNGTLFISDGSSASIIATDITDGFSKVIYHENAESKITALAYDHAGNNLYWCDTGKGTVEILSLQTMAKKVLIHDAAGEIATSIALIPDEGVMFIAFKKSEHGYHIDRFRMDGTGRTHIVEQGLLGPVSLFYESGLHRVFWTDANAGVIESTSAEGDDRHSFRSLSTNPVSLGSLSKDIFWTNEKSKKLTWTDKHNPKYDRKITLDVPDNVDNLYLVSASSKPITPHPCHTDNGKCSHICLSHGKTFECACPVGMKLKPDNSTCFKPLQCFVNQFFCKKSDVCIESVLICNGHRDCLLGEDEENCPTQCWHDEFRCNDGQCIKSASVCDMHFDCLDRSDEASEVCSDRKKCPDDNFRCNSGTCIANRFVCDGQKDCYDGEDERDCNFATCTADQFRCTSGACIPKTWECDKQFDCYDLSDEHAGCAQSKCTDDQFTCKNGRCIDKIFKCDRSDDCGDMSDELDCDVKTIEEGPCHFHEFQCTSDDSICLPQQAVCNGTSECPHMEDEKNCSSCHVDEFQCRNGNCLTREWICDGADDCGDMSDEENDLCSLNTTTPIRHSAAKVTGSCTHGFRCKNGNCLDMSFVCNGKEDCSDGSDEHGSCNSSCEADTNPCHQTCLKTPSGPMCACQRGYLLLGDGQNCVDIKECDLQPPICSQLCTDMPGSYYCGCHDGYVLRSDKKSCKSIGEPMSMVFVTNNQIRRLTQSNNTLSILYSDETADLTGLDLSIRENLVYFSIKESGTIHRLNIANSSRDYMMNAGAPHRLTVDWLTQNVYFVDVSGYNAGVKVCNFNKKEYGTLFQTEANSEISAIAIDPIKKYLFYATTTWWVFNSPTSVIYRRTLDGMKKVEIFKSSGSHITGLAVDLRARQVYFSDMHDGTIKKTDYEGSDNIVVASNLTRPTGLNFFEDHLFFMSHGGFMGKCKLFGEDEDRKCDSFRMTGNSGNLFVISQISRQPAAENVCHEANCTDLCVPAEAGAKCLCNDGKVVFQGEPCQSFAREAVQDGDKKPTFKQHKDVLQNSAQQSSSSIVVGVLVTAFVLLCAGMVYLYIRKRNSGRFNVVSMKFYNPMFGVQPPENNDETFDVGSHTVLQPGEHEYANPVHINNQDMEAATNAILQKVTPLLKIDE